MRLHPIYSVYILLMLVACASGEQDDSTAKDADQLFYLQKKVLSQYVDSLAKAPDSVSADRLINDLSERLYRISAEYQQSVTEKLSPDQNETLTRLTEKAASTAQKKMRVHVPDSTANIAPDSINR